MLATSKNVLTTYNKHRYWWPDTDYCPSSSEADNQSVESSVLVIMT